MGIMDNLDKDKLVDMAKDQASQHHDQIDAGIDRAGDMAAEKLGHGEQIDQAGEFAKSKLDELNSPEGTQSPSEGDPVAE